MSLTAHVTYYVIWRLFGDTYNYSKHYHLVNLSSVFQARDTRLLFYPPVEPDFYLLHSSN